MKTLLVVATAAALLVGCTSNRYTGGYYDYTGTPEVAGADNSVIHTNGPGMHSPTRTGLPGPGTTGIPSGWTGGDRP